MFIDVYFLPGGKQESSFSQMFPRCSLETNLSSVRDEKTNVLLEGIGTPLKSCAEVCCLLMSATLSYV